MDWANRWGDGYVTTRPIRWGRPAVEVPKGFPFNVSVPRGLRWLIDPHDPKLRKAAALHDFVLHYLNWSRPTAAGLWNDVLRDDADLHGSWRFALFLAVGMWQWR